MESSSTPSGTAPAPAKKSRTGMFAIIGVIVIIIIAVVALYYAGYLGGMQTANADITAADDGTCTPAGDAACKFTPTSFSTTVGKVVTFKNGGTTAHTVTPNPNATTTWPNSGQTISGGQSYTVTFTSAGTYSYYCTLHQWMKGNVTVT